MKERPILFSAQMVRAILDGRKTQTRRVIKPQPFSTADGSWHIELNPRSGYNSERTLRNNLPARCPYGDISDRLWVRETFQLTEPSGSVGDEWIGDTASELDSIPNERPESLGYWIYCHYRADDQDMCSWWRPSIFMPRWASRITLEIVNIRVERLHNITRDDVLAEGIVKTEDGSWLGPLAGVPDFPWAHATEAYASLWNDINAERGFGWDVNPWVWVIEFKRVEEIA